MPIVNHLEEQSKLEKMIRENEFYVINFCKQEGVKLLKTNVTIERGYCEPIYIFSDNLGSYTIDGIKGSLK